MNPFIKSAGVLTPVWDWIGNNAKEFANKTIGGLVEGSRTGAAQGSGISAGLDALKNLQQYGQDALNYVKNNKLQTGGGLLAALGIYGGYKGVRAALARNAQRKAQELRMAPFKGITNQLADISSKINGRQFGQELVMGMGDGLKEMGNAAYNKAKDLVAENPLLAAGLGTAGLGYMGYNMTRKDPRELTPRY